MNPDTTGQEEQLREDENTNSRVEGKDRGRCGQTMGVGRNEGQDRMFMVDQMDKEGNS